MTTEQLNCIEADHTAVIEDARERYLTERNWVKTSSGFWLKFISPMPTITSSEMAVMIEIDMEGGLTPASRSDRYSVDSEYF